MASIEIDTQKCNACADCVDACPSSVFEMVDGKVKIVNLEDCIECCACVDICEPEALVHDTC
ncbi:MAG: 4Fe-4S dicluster domain-containing protein [Candidatus Hydrothermarchaeales archaeon]